MRYSSVKSLAVILSFVGILSTAAPAAEARPVQPSNRPGIVQTIRQIVNRFFGGMTANGSPTIPIPSAEIESVAPESGKRMIPLPTDPTQQ